ncbi:hypothetical protein E3N88_10793 [Mikania micrantha]|uniref:Cytochrome P450 n=1 Tax=Mikania micrantha TaxID=192012 RepID=A0A5N6PDE5_9ASTR|nr:hypothetical protein E3N88_10793 [Mikania micrantha]
MHFFLHVFLFSSLPFILFLSKFCFSHSKSRKNLPPSPPKLPLIGNLHQLGSSPHRTLQTMAQTYGPLMLIHLGTVPVLVASSVDAAKEIMKTHDLVFASRPQLDIPSRIFYGNKDIAFSQYGEYWRQIKSIAVLHLLSNKRVQSYQHVRSDEMGLMMDKILRSNGSVLNLSELIIALTNNVVCRVALGRTYEGRKFKNLLQRAMELLGCFSVGSYIPSLKWVDRLSGLVRKADDVAKELDEFLEGVIEEHLNEKRAGVEDQDLVDILLEFQRDNLKGFRLERDMVKAVIMDLFAAGTDTTFTSLEWAISELLRHPRVMQKLRQEALEIGQGRSSIPEDDLEKMPDSSNWYEPDEFRPERFLNSTIDYKGFHFELIPFGAGRRGCPGIQFAMSVNELVLANLVYMFDLEFLGEEVLDMSETSGITVHKKLPILVSATARFK